METTSQPDPTEPTPPADEAVTGQPDLPYWRCHKVVRAAKIEKIEPCPYLGVGWHDLFLDTPGGTLVRTVQPTYIDRHKPKVGGYYVLYEDGYESFSPAEPFQNGYTRIEEPTGGAPTGRDLAASPDESHAREHPAN